MIALIVRAAMPNLIAHRVDAGKIRNSMTQELSSDPAHIEYLPLSQSRTGEIRRGMRGVSAARENVFMSASPSVQSLHHVGFVVAEIATAMDGFIRSLAGVWDGRIFEDPHQKVKVAFLAVKPGDPLIELVEPDGPDSPVLRFLKEQGGGLHHVCYEVGDLLQHIAEMKSRGCFVIRQPTPAVAFDGRRIAWIYTSGKLLVELLEKGDEPLR